MAGESIRCPSWQDFPDIELYMDQVISVLERFLAPFCPEEEKCITSTMINNYVKSKILLPPQNKRYTRAQLSRLFMICILKRFMQLSDIGQLLENLSKKRTEEEVYLLFTAELDRAMADGAWEETGEGETENTLRLSLVAVAAVHRARVAFMTVQKSWPRVLSDEEKKEKEKKAKEKEKEKKAKEKKKK